MIEGSLKFLSLWKNEFWKVEDKISEDTFILLTLSRSEGFLGCLWQRIWSAIHFRLRSLKLRRELQALSNASPKTVDRQTPDRDRRIVWLGVKQGRRVFENIQEASNSFIIGTSVRCSQTFIPIIFFISWFGCHAPYYSL